MGWKKKTEINIKVDFSSNISNSIDSYKKKKKKRNKTKLPVYYSPDVFKKVLKIFTVFLCVVNILTVQVLNFWAK